MTVTVGNVKAKPGKLERGELRVGSMADGSPIQLPVFIASGVKDGPTVWVEGCIHGEEYGGAASIIQFMRSLDIGTLSGTVIGIPVANPASFNFRSRVSSIDGQNLNRIFPGSPDGSHSFQLAAVIGEHLEKHADYLLDLHSGGIGAEVPFYVIYKDDGTQNATRSRELAKRVGVETIWRAAEIQGMGGTVTAESLRHNIPSVTVECGGGTFTQQHLNDYLVSIKGFLQATGNLPGDAPVRDSYTIISGGSFIHNREGGLFVPACKVGDILPKGAMIGTLINLHGETVEEIPNPYADSYIAALRCNYFPTHAGEICAEAIPVELREGL
ncbi:succinylglutamate desuccinylase/aspartoacylase family protein [Oceanibium sediminis]|uniref:succinylglutamate desuccinylase/aspartoacylase family protein n=1 Tax=Oceanibium sediminis TaxID=2026339 RepID=UPI000DD457BF|nr:succinylglutamate desuccinylase/aspartoacylase family protein [Oceanibium sediminis]